MFIVSDSDLDFNRPVVRIKIDRSKASDLGINVQQIGSTLATLLGGNYVNRFNLEGRSYQGDSAGATRPAAVAGFAWGLLRPDQHRAAGAFVFRSRTNSAIAQAGLVNDQTVNVITGRRRTFCK
jgi:hypothetical protein